MATTVKYRLSSGEVIKVDLLGQTFDGRDVVYFGKLTDPPFPDGTDIRADTVDVIGPLRVLGLSKIWDGTDVRNATQAEIDGFAAPQIDDDNKQDRDEAANLGDIHPLWRKLIKAIVKGVIRENNIMAGRYNALRAEMLAATNLNDLQNRIQNNTQDAPIRTNQQAFDAIRTDVNKDD